MITGRDVEKDLLNEEYKFLSENEHLGNNIILLTLGGSKAYGTNIETKEHTSDTDIRGIALNSPREILLRKDFEQVTDEITDTVVYSFNKIIELLSKTNPNTIEMLGCRPEQYIYLTSIGKDLIKNNDMFLSKIAVHTFGGYANAQLRRLENALARDNYPQSEKERHILGSIRHALYSLTERYINFSKLGDKKLESILENKDARNAVDHMKGSMKRITPEIDKLRNKGSIFNMYVDDTNREGFDSEIYCDIYIEHAPLRDCVNFFSETGSVIRDYDKLGKRNTKKDDVHLNKHAMHLIRLYLMAFDILEKGKIITYREADLDLLMSIRNGAYMKEDGSFRKEFFEMVDEMEKRLEYDAKNTHLPDNPNYDRIGDFVADINRRVIMDTAKDMNLDDYIKKNSQIR